MPTEIEEQEMSGEIVLDKDFTLKKELRSWVLLYKRNKIGKESGKPTIDYVPNWYPTIQSALQGYLDLQAKKASGDVRDILAKVDEAMNRIEVMFKDVPSALETLGQSLRK